MVVVVVVVIVVVVLVLEVMVEMVVVLEVGVCFHAFMLSWFMLYAGRGKDFFGEERNIPKKFTRFARPYRKRCAAG